MASTQAFHFTTQLEIPLDPRIVQHPETIHHGRRTPDHFHYPIRVQIKIGPVSHRQNNGIGSGQGLIQVILNGGFLQFVLVPEKPGPFFRQDLQDFTGFFLRAFYRR